MTPVHDGEWLWIAAQELANPVPPEKRYTRACRVIAIHKPTRSFRGSVDLPSDANLTGLIATPQALYAITDRYGGKDEEGEEKPAPVLSLDKAALIREAAGHN
jgi:hypothetical protein